ncbi:hypothetical protein [Actinomycetospora flava]|uniref:Uncharacterized protein n=1 Tax=Actinomycetospora flava TaxID=3129232 RepID=A0ABU8M490_9PSEU
MTDMLQSALPHRDPVATLFAAALDGDARAEHALRELARTDDLAADALCALASCEVDDADPTHPADVAAIDQLIAAVLEAVGPPRSGMSRSC